MIVPFVHISQMHQDEMRELMYEFCVEEWKTGPSKTFLVRTDRGDYHVSCKQLSWARIQILIKKEVHGNRRRHS